MRLGRSLGLNRSCVPEQVTAVFSDAAPTLELLVAPEDPRVGDVVTLSGVAAGGVPPYRFDWSVDGDAVGAGAPVVRWTARRAGVHSVVLVVADATGCRRRLIHGLLVVP